MKNILFILVSSLLITYYVFAQAAPGRKDGVTETKKDHHITGSQIMPTETPFGEKKKEKEDEILKQRNQIQQLELEKRNRLLLVFVIISVLLVILLFVIYNRFRLKQKANLVIRAEKEKAGKSLLKLIDSVLDFSKIEAGKMDLEPVPVDITMIFREVGGIFKEQFINQKLTYVIDVEKNLPYKLMLDETRLRQILLNIVGNAVKFTNDGYIKVSAKGNYKTENHDKIDLFISVSDTGIGILVEDQNHIFEPFQQQSVDITQTFGGTGLGLPISRKLAAIMNGRISVESNAGEGSTFNIILEDVPVIAMESTPPDEESLDLKLIHFEKATVLVVDEVESIRVMLQGILTRFNLEVLTAGSGQDALQIAGERLPDVILMDLIMPEMDGIEAVKRLKNDPKTKHIPVIVITASVKDIKNKNIPGCGWVWHLEKPIRVNRLFRVLSAYIGYSLTLERPAPEPSERYEPLPEETVKGLPLLIRTLREEFLPELEHFEGVLKMEDVKNFGIRVKQLGIDFGIPQLVDYADQLDFYEQSFDITAIEKVLEEFPAMVEALDLHKENDNE
ncbi:MAG: response regulator [bacterium]|nr:response regulator [bacterium]